MKSRDRSGNDATRRKPAAIKRGSRRTRWGSSRRSGLAVREVALIIAAVAALLAIGIPYIYRQRTIHRRQICETRQFRLSIGIIQKGLDDRQLPGYRVLQATDEMGIDRPTSWVYPVLPYLYPLAVDLGSTSGAAEGIDRQGWVYRVEEDMLIAPNGPFSDVFVRHGPSGDAPNRGTSPSVYISELMCPEAAPRSPDPNDSLTSFVANCGMPDVQATDVLPADWRANGVFTDQFPGNVRRAQPTTLEYLEEHDGLANIVMLSENVDAGLWTDTREASIGFVWTTTIASAPSALVKDIWSPNRKVGEGTGKIQSARPSSRHQGGFNVAFCNGATQFINDDIDSLAWTWMMMSDSKEPRFPGSDALVPSPIRREDDTTIFEDADDQNGDTTDRDANSEEEPRSSNNS